MPILSDAEIYELAFGAFGDLGRDTAVIFGAICLAESGGNTEAVLDNVAGGWQPEGSPYQWDRGLAQVNSIHGFDAQRLLDDPAYNVACARAIYNQQGFQAWSVFKGGQFRAFLARMEAVAGVVPVPPLALPPPFMRDDLRPLYLQVYGYESRVLIEPDGFEADGRRRYRLILP